MIPDRTLSIVVLLVSLHTVCLSFRVRRSGLAGYDDPYGLTNALQVIDRERRRSNHRAHLQQEIFDADDMFFNPNAEPDIPDDYLSTLDYLENGEEPEYYPGYNFDVTPFDRYPIPYGALEDKEYGPIKRTAYRPHRVSPSYNQLKDIFGESSIPQKRMAPQIMPELLKEEENIRKAEQDTRMLAHKMGTLMSEAEKVTEKEVVTQIDGEPPKVIKEIKIEKTDPDGKTKTLEEIFDGADSDSDENAKDGNETEATDEDDSSEAIADSVVGQTKTKRASSEPCAQEAAYIGELLTEIARLRKKLSTLEVEQVLEDKENDLLADALVYSTMDQIGGGNEFVNDEYNDISKATETEELIQMLANGMKLESIDFCLKTVLGQYSQST